MFTTNVDVSYVQIISRDILYSRPLPPNHKITKIKTVVMMLLLPRKIELEFLLTSTFAAESMRESVGCLDRRIDILKFIDQLPDEESKMEAHLKIEAVERKAMAEMEPQDGILELFEFLSRNEISKSICTRNLIKPVNHLIENFIPEDLQNFEHIVTRDFYPPKPRPEPLLHISKQLNIDPTEMIMVGDSIDDMKSGTDAGFTTILLVNNVNRHLIDDKSLAHYNVETLSEIIDLFEEVVQNI